MMNKAVSYGVLLLIALASAGFVFAQDQGQSQPAAPATVGDDEIYRVQIRVIFAGSTGIIGVVPNELSDMKTTLTKSFRYPSYTLWNTVRLSFFGTEESTALLFPDYYLRLIPKGRTQDGKRQKIKVELYYLPPENNTTAKFYLPGPALPKQNTQKTIPPVVGVETNPQKPQPLFPVISSALILTPQSWEGIGGIPVRINLQEKVSTSRLSSSPIPSPGISNALGQKKNLILGLKLEE